MAWVSWRAPTLAHPLSGVAAHNGGAARRYRRSRLPVEPAWARELPDRRAARREEARIKRLPRAATLALIAGDDAPA